MAATSYLTLTPSVGNRRLFTISFWLKRSHLSSNQIIVMGGATGFWLMLHSSNTLYIRDYQSSAYQIDLRTNRVFEDCTSWYHIVVAVDTAQATAANRVKLYVNGVQETSFSTATYPSQNHDTVWNTAVSHEIGRESGVDGDYLEGHLAHFANVDGTACAPTVFGETDSTTGEWKPILSPSVTWGDEGWWLKFENSGALGTDSSGNSNTFTVNGNLKQSISTPSNNFLTFDEHQTNSANIRFAGTGLYIAPGAWCTTATNYAMLKGKWYVEMKYAAGTYTGLGFFRYGGNYSADVTNSDHYPGEYPEGYFYKINQKTLATNNVETAYSGWDSISAGDIAMMAIDLDNGKAWYGVNGTWQDTGSGVGVPNTGAYPHHTFTVGGFYWGVAGGGYDGTTIYFNFGEGRFGTTALASANDDNNSNGTFEYAPPAGFYSICTKNIKAYG
tara:strand:+ start:364 stop:1695 length:1332 start_codon:yes stop_codon:yes gene_type:complete